MPTLSELTKKIQDAADALPAKKAALDEARLKAKVAEQEFLKAGAEIKSLYADYQKLMQDVLSLGGGVHQ